MKLSLHSLDKCLLCSRHVLNKSTLSIQCFPSAYYLKASWDVLVGGRLMGLVAALQLTNHLLFCFSAQQDSIKKANMKRENKAYSFKEQIIELELKEVSTRRHCTQGAG